MAVDALELRPRNAVALLDAAVRVCATSAGVWAVTLPAGAALVAAAFSVAEAIQRRGPLAVPVALFTLAWAFRAISQGAAAHYLEQQVLRTEPPSVRASFAAAFRRAPSLVITAFVLLAINGLLWGLSLGLGFLLLSAHLVGYAAAMRGQGHPLAIYGTCARLLGQARGRAAAVRLGGLAQVLVFFNLHLAVTFGLQIVNLLIGLDTTFASRFCSLDNGTWVAALVATTFACFEPIRAATATLLLVDARVRQEGLDLLAAAEQLPRRRAAPRAAAAAVVGALTLLGAGTAQAAGNDALIARISRIAAQCEIPVDGKDLAALEGLGEREHSALSRFVARVERSAIDEEDCDYADLQLVDGLEQIRGAQAALAKQDARSARDAAQHILQRPEFQVTPPATPEEEAEAKDQSPGWFAQAWKRFWEAVLEWLQKRDVDKPERTKMPEASGGQFGADLVIVLAIAAVVALLAFLLFQFRKRSVIEDVEASADTVVSTPLADDPMSALSRPAETWAGLADELAARGRFRDAVRHLYLALLSRLHHRGAIDYDAALSNWDYLRGFKGQVDQKGRFRDLTLRFDFAWYGSDEVDAGTWQTFRGVAEPLLAQPAGGAPGV